jgi:hypothetical protein
LRLRSASLEGKKEEITRGRTEVGGRRGGDWETGGLGERPEVGSRRTDDSKRQRPEVGGWKSEVGSRKSEAALRQAQDKKSERRIRISECGMGGWLV